MLISVRSLDEFQLAVDNGVEIIDWKEPRNGALSPVAPQMWQQSVDLRDKCCTEPTRMPRLSAALGEAQDFPDIASQVPSEFDFAKVGASGCDTSSRICRLWRDVRQELNSNVELVAVAYADYQAANCVGVEEIFKLAGENGFKRCLIDTFVKDGLSTLDHLTLEQMKVLGAIANRHNFLWTLAGSIRLSMVRTLNGEGVKPDCFAVRGDVCQSKRTSRLDGSRVSKWKAVLSSMKLDEDIRFTKR